MRSSPQHRSSTGSLTHWDDRLDSDRAAATIASLELTPRQATLEDLFFQLTEDDGQEPLLRREQLIEELA